MPATAELLAAAQAAIAAAARRAGRDPARVRLVAVTKTATPEALGAAWAGGLRDFAHNRVQALEAHRVLLPQARWHLIGPIQSNKIRRAAQAADVVQSVGDLRVASGLATAAAALARAPVEVLAQVNLTPADGRYGCRAEDLPALLAAVSALPALRCRGLMTIAPQHAPPAQLRSHFARLAELARAAAAAGQLPPDPELSMGMTEDFEIAVEEGATLVRLGRALFPSRTEAA
ncbi:MAG: YggS family pyridoxal phosphate-dependent enzyme [Planctomycetota bacterium]|nr:MAG: YggS family pyridoxal phosphate-dependent enzyme [Planctomycetota bacterium]